MDEKELEKLRALLEKATANYDIQKKENEKLAADIKALMEKQDQLVADFGKKETATPEEVKQLQDELEDLKLQIENTLGKSRNTGIELSAEQKQKMHEAVIKPAIGEWLKGKQNSTHAELFKFIENSATEKFKALNLTNPSEGGLAVAEVLGRDIIQYAREYSNILMKVGRNPLMTRDYRELVLISYPSVREGVENVAGTNFPNTSTPTFAEVRSHTFKVEAEPRLTDEAMYGNDIDLYGKLVELLGEEMGIYLSAQVWYGNGTGKNARGILSSNRVNITGESLKPTLDPVAANQRNHDFFPVKKSGVAGRLGSDNISSADFLIDLVAALPTKYLNGAEWHMNRKTEAVIQKIRDNDGNPIFIRSYQEGGRARIMGYPVNIDDTMPDIAANSTPIVFGRMDLAYCINDGDIDKVLLNPYKVTGCTIIEYAKEMFEMIGKSDAIIIAALAA